MTELGRMTPSRRSGSEPFQNNGDSLGSNLLDFWRWSVSDLVSNATRGRLAEYIVARGLGISTAGVRDEWAACDLCTPDGVQIEVKSAAYLQSWHQSKPSAISFSIRKSRAWSPDTNALSAEPIRTADVYVFALLGHMSKATLDPLDLAQWRFYVVSTLVFNARGRGQHSITLPSLERLAASAVTFAQLGVAVKAATETGDRTVSQP